MGTPWNVRTAFASVEAAVVVGMIGLACCVAAVGGQHARTRAGLAGSLANLKKIAEVGAHYAADYDEQVWSFTWNADEHETSYPDLESPGVGAAAVMYQSTDIVRRLSGDDTIPRLTNRFRPPFTSLLVLADYLGESLPAEWMVSPGDAVRLGWQADPDNPPEMGDDSLAWRYIFGLYGSSYGLMPAFWARDEATMEEGNTVYQYPSQHDLFWVPTMDFGNRRESEILFPAQKVRVAERESYFFGVRPVYYLHPSARVPLLMADGSAAARTTADANTSFKPNNPPNQGGSAADYRPNPIYEAPTVSGGELDDKLEMYYKWTRRGLRGIDFSGERAE